MSTIVLNSAQLRQIRAHGEATYPEECGGLLLGRLEGEQKVIVEVVSLENIRQDSRHNRVELAPLDYLRAEKRAAALGLGVWGYYHSHPDHPAIPSQFDLEHAPMADWSYVIVSVKRGQAHEVLSWKLAPERAQFLPETLVESEDSP